MSVLRQRVASLNHRHHVISQHAIYTVQQKKNSPSDSGSDCTMHPSFNLL